MDLEREILVAADMTSVLASCEGTSLATELEPAQVDDRDLMDVSLLLPTRSRGDAIQQAFG